MSTVRIMVRLRAKIRVSVGVRILVRIRPVVPMVKLELWLGRGRDCLRYYLCL